MDVKKHLTYCNGGDLILLDCREGMINYYYQYIAERI